MKRIFGVLLSVLFLLSLCSVAAFAAEENDISKFELPAPKAPNYFVYTDGNATEGHHDHLRMIMVADPEVALLAAEYDRDSEAFYEKYGLWSFEICIQYRWMARTIGNTTRNGTVSIVWAATAKASKAYRSDPN